MAECSLSTGRIVAPWVAAVSISNAPAVTRLSLLAKAKVRPPKGEHAATNDVTGYRKHDGAAPAAVGAAAPTNKPLPHYPCSKALTLAAQMKSFSLRPSMAWVVKVTLQ